MTLATVAKDVHSWWTDRLHPQPVVFHHVPKCAGTSVSRALRMRYFLSQTSVRPQNSYRAVRALSPDRSSLEIMWEMQGFHERLLLYHLFSDVRCIASHILFSKTAWELFHDRYKFITILRHPVDRFISHYYHEYKSDYAFGTTDKPLEEFIEHESTTRYGEIYIRFFASLPPGADCRTPEAISAAKENLERFDVVGFLSDLDAFETQARKALGVKLRVGHHNKGKNKKPNVQNEIPHALMEKIREMCRPDIELYDFAVEKFGRSAHR